LFAVFSAFPPPQAAEKQKKRRNGVREAAFLVANPSLRLGQAQRGRDQINKPQAGWGL
jgi:hypothetical protein